MDGQTDNFHRTLLSMMRAFVNKYHSNWEDILPSLLYAYHNTIHSATGYTPHRLLFGWTPRDLRVPMLSACAPAFPEVEEWLLQRHDELRKAGLSLEAARAAMIRAYKPAAIRMSTVLVTLLKFPHVCCQCVVLPHRWLSFCPGSLALSK